MFILFFFFDSSRFSSSHAVGTEGFFPFLTFCSFRVSPPVCSVDSVTVSFFNVVGVTIFPFSPPFSPAPQACVAFFSRARTSRHWRSNYMFPPPFLSLYIYAYSNSVPTPCPTPFCLLAAPPLSLSFSFDRSFSPRFSRLTGIPPFFLLL